MAQTTAPTRFGGGDQDAPRHTVVGVFEDDLDTQQALAALRKAHFPPEQVSVVVRDPEVGDDNPAERAIAVARSIAATALEAVGGWLHGLAALIVPERGSFLVAGPLGAALAGIHADEAHLPAHLRSGATAEGDDANSRASATALINTLEEFGFGGDEAAYLESRLTAGAPLIGVTASDQADLQSVRQIFAAHNAVYIGMAQTDARIADEAQALLAAAPEASSGGDVVVTDAVAPLRKLCGDDATPTAWSAGLCGRDVVDANGAEAGCIEDLLADASHGVAAAMSRDALRYVIVAYGGVLGIGRHRVALPAGQVDLDATPARLSVTKDVLQHGPNFDPATPFSRREEHAVCAYFGCDPYWIPAGEAVGGEQ